MTVRKLRDYPSDAELARLYATPHDHLRFPDHKVRVGITVEVGVWVADEYLQLKTIGDLSCGNGHIPRRIAGGASETRTRLYLGDYAPGYEFTGPLEKTLDELPAVDLYVCSETIEHLTNPNETLRRLRVKAHALVLSTPIDEDAQVGNPEHVWGWGVGDVREMLHAAGWNPVCLSRLELPNHTYDFQIWGCM